MDTSQPSSVEIHLEKSDFSQITQEDLASAIREEKENIESYLREQISKAGETENQRYVERVLADILEKMADMAKTIDRLDTEADAKQDAQSEYAHQKAFKIKHQKVVNQTPSLEEMSPDPSAFAHASDPFLVVNLMAKPQHGMENLWRVTVRLGYSSLDSSNILFFSQVLEGNNSQQPKDQNKKSKKE